MAESTGSTIKGKGGESFFPPVKKNSLKLIPVVLLRGGIRSGEGWVVEGGGHTSYLSFFVHGQDFSSQNFTPKSA